MPPRSNRELAMLAGLLGIGVAGRRGGAGTQPGEIAERASASRLNSPSRERTNLMLQGITKPGEGIGSQNKLFESLAGLSSLPLGGAPTINGIFERLGIDPALRDLPSYGISRLPGAALVPDQGQIPLQEKSVEKALSRFKRRRA